MSKGLTERANKNIRILLDLIEKNDNFTAKEMEELFKQANKGDIWIDGPSVEDFLNNLEGLSVTFVPSAIYYHSKKKSDNCMHSSGKNMKILFGIIDSKIRFTLQEIEKEFAKKNNNDTSLPENFSIQEILDFWCKTGDLECYDGVYVHPDRI